VFINVTLWYEFDNSILSNGAVTINLIGATYADGMWYIVENYAAVSSHTYDTVATNGADTYGITSVNQNFETATVIWDQIQVQSYTIADTRVDIFTAVTITVHLHYAFDGSDVTSTGGNSNMTMNGFIAREIGGGDYQAIIEYDTPTVLTLNDIASGGNEMYGITSVSQNSVTKDVAWDEIYVVSISVTDSRVNIGDAVTVTIHLHYLAYPAEHVLGGNVFINLNATIAGVPPGDWELIGYSRAMVMMCTFNTITIVGDTYGITQVYNSKSATVIWDQIKVIEYIVADTYVDLSVSVNINVRLCYSYDNNETCTGGVFMMGVAALDVGDGLWRITDSEAVATANTYNAITTDGLDTYGITSIDNNGQTVTVSWDDVVVQSYTASATLVEIYTYVDLTVHLHYGLGGNVILGTCTLNGYLATAVGGSPGDYKASITFTVGTAYTFNTVAGISGDYYGITTVDQNGKSQVITWLQVKWNFWRDDVYSYVQIQVIPSASVVNVYENDTSTPTWALVVTAWSVPAVGSTTYYLSSTSDGLTLVKIEITAGALTMTRYTSYYVSISYDYMKIRLFNQYGKLLPFNQFNVYVNGTLTYFDESYVDDSTYYTVLVQDRWGATINSTTFAYARQVNVILAVYELGVYNFAEKYIYYVMTKSGASYSWTGFIGPTEGRDFELYTGTYMFTAYDGSAPTSQIAQYDLQNIIQDTCLIITGTTIDDLLTYLKFISNKAAGDMADAAVALEATTRAQGMLIWLLVIIIIVSFIVTISIFRKKGKVYTEYKPETAPKKQTPRNPVEKQVARYNSINEEIERRMARYGGER
jgi:hypothetical protein